MSGPGADPTARTVDESRTGVGGSGEAEIPEARLLRDVARAVQGRRVEAA